MKRDRALVAFLAIFLILIVNPLASVDSCTRGIESQEAPFLTAADGAESSESRTSFSETLAEDDVLFYPDAFNNGTATHSTSGFVVSGVESNNHTYTHSNDDSFWGITSPPNELICELWFSSEVTNGALEGFTFAFDFNSVKDVDAFIYNHTSSSWVNITFDDAHWANGSTYDPDYWNTTHIGFRINSTDAISDLYVDYAEVTFYYMTLADSDHYAESFSSVSDWAIQTGNTITTDGDIGSFHIDGDSAWDYYYSNSPSLANMLGYYVEYRFSANVSGSMLRVFGFALDDHAGATYVLDGDANLFPTTTAQTKRFYIPHNVALESIRIHLKAPSVDTEVKFDCFRVGPANETGWQHDFSTTSGISSADGGTIATDADKVTLTADGDGSTFLIVADTTATATAISCTYYPMFGIDIDSGTGSWALEQYDGSAYATLQSSTAISAGTKRFNMRALDTYVSWWRITLTASAVLVSDWCKAYSIANFTVTQSGAGTDDYLYTDSGVLYSNIDDGYIELNHDPALSVSDTYSYYNLTTSGTAPEFSQYVSDWSTYSDDTRDATTSGTVIDIKLKFDSTEIISAIKFIEDGIAPAVVRSSSTPNDPEDDEAVTLSAVITDAVGVWSVVFDAIVYPTGFSDVDYDASEQADNLWTYEFSSLIAGYYCFKIIATDGANNNSLTEYAYIEITVREATIEISTYTFFGASSDFTYMQYSGHISHDCTYNISEWSTTWAKNETHTGSVTEGMFNIAWDKIGVDDAEANFTIVFVSGTLSLTIEGYYGTAYKALQVTEIDFVNLEQSDSWTTNLTINFYTNKEVDWNVYDRDNDDAVLHSGTTTEGDGFITWVQNTARGAHHFAVKWTDGISDQWYNNSYWVFDRNIDDLPGGADPGADQRRTIEFWATIGGIAGILGIMVIGLSHYNMDEKIKNLPNYRTQERGRR